MKNLILLALVLLVGCGKDSVVFVDKPVDKIVYIAQDFEGYYFCENNSSLELIVDYRGRVTFETSGQSLNSINPANDTLGTHPVISERDLIVNNNRLSIAPRNYTYSSSTYDLEQDISGSNITGSRRTDLKVTKEGASQIKIKFDIWAGAVNSNINNIVATRIIVCDK